MTLHELAHLFLSVVALELSHQGWILGATVVVGVVLGCLAIKLKT